MTRAVALGVRLSIGTTRLTFVLEVDVEHCATQVFAQLGANLTTESE